MTYQVNSPSTVQCQSLNLNPQAWLYSSFHLVFYSLLKYELKNVTKHIMFLLISLYIISYISKLSSFHHVSGYFFSPLSLTFISVYLYISGREGDVDRKNSVPTTVLSIFKFPLQILPSNRSKYSSLQSTILSHFRR